MNGLHYIICSWENTFDAPSNRCVCLETIARAPTAFVFTPRRFVSFEEPDSPIQSFQVPSVLTTSLADCNSSNYSAFFQPPPLRNQKLVRSPLTQTWPEFGRRARKRNQARPGWAGFILEDKTLQRKQQSESVFGGADEAHRCVLHAVSQQSDSLMCLKGRVSQRVFSTNSSSRSKPHDSQH